jgi:phosphoesterase RecJ-like protein
MPDPSQQILDTVSRCKRVLITTHVRPDGDALGSTAAMVMGLKQKGIESKVLLLSHLPRKYAFVYEENGIPFFDAETGWPAELKLDDYDAMLVVDTGTWSQLPGLREHVEKWPKPKLVVDHHLTQEDWADVKLVDTTAGAAGEIIEELLMKWGVELDRGISTALFLAIVSDTGWFMYSNTRPGNAAPRRPPDGRGVDTDAIYQRLKQSERPERILLHTRAYQSLELLADGKLAVMTIRKQDFADRDSHVNDTEDMINLTAADPQRWK